MVKLSELIGDMQLLLSKIPKGRVTSYKEIAKQLGIHHRAAGKLLGMNTDGEKYPCFKVINSDGRLGGFSNPKGLKDKIRRLKKDGVEIKNNRVGKEYFYYF